MKDIRGAGGGGGKGGGGGGGSSRAPVESPDSLRSIQYARVLDLVSEGEVEGLVNGLQSVYLDDTPVQNADGTNNFTGVTLVTRNGTQAQSYIPGFPAVESETPVSAEVKASASVTRTISDSNINAVRVTISVPRLTLQNSSTGDITGTSVDIAIDVQNNGGGFVEQIADTINGKTTTRYQRSYRIELPAGGPWDIRVRRVTADSTSSNLSNQTYWESYTSIIDAKLTYPNSALCGVSVDASQFRNIPKRGYDLKGLRVRIPSNYDPVTRAYTGAWDGTFSIAWTDNPAWCFYDLVTNARYGLGDFVTSADKWALYTIGQYCDQLVDDGFGGQEPRFTCNLYLQTREEAQRVIASLAAVFRGMSYWAGGQLGATQDSPMDPVALFTPANVVGGANGFQYSGSSAKTRHTVCLVTWNDPDDKYRQKIEYVEDREGIARYGVVETSLIAVGCTSRGQAHRMGRWLLYTERMETETVSFQTGLDGLALRPGEVIQTTDPVRAGGRMGGRILSATTSVIQLDSEVTLDGAEVYTLYAVLPDGSVEGKAVATAAGTTDTLTVSPAYSTAPQEMAIWVLSATNLLPETWRVITVTEVDDVNAQVMALAYRSDKYDAVEAGLILEPLQTSSITTTPDPVQDITVSESLYAITAVVVGARITVGWTSPAASFLIRWRKDGGNWEFAETTANSYDIQPAQPGTYEFSVTAINAIGRSSTPTAAQKTIYGLTADPSDVANLSLNVMAGTAHLSFDAATDLDVVIGGYMRVRYAPVLTGAEWSSAVDIGPQIPGTARSAALPALAGSYLAKWVDSSGKESTNAVVVTTNAASIITLNFVQTLDEAPAFAGVKTGVAVHGGGLVLDSLETIGDQLGDVTTWPLLSVLGGGVQPEGTYEFGQVVDLGSVQTSRITAAITTVGYDAADLISMRPLISLWPSVVGTLISDVGCDLYVSTTTDDPNASPVTWSPWQIMTVGDYTFRGVRFYAVLRSSYATHNIRVEGLSVTIDMPDRVESGVGIVSGAGAKAVTFATAYMTTPALGITAHNMATGDYYVITATDEVGFTVTFYNAAGVAVSRTFDWIAKGY